MKYKNVEQPFSKTVTDNFELYSNNFLANKIVKTFMKRDHHTLKMSSLT